MVQVVMKPSGMSCYSVTLQTLLPKTTNSNSIPLTLIFPFLFLLSLSHSLFTENLMLMQQIIKTASQLFQTLPTDPQFKENLDLLRYLVCDLITLIAHIYH